MSAGPQGAASRAPRPPAAPAFPGPPGPVGTRPAGAAGPPGGLRPPEPRDERGIRPNLPPSWLARPSRNPIRPGRPALMSAEELRPLCLGGLEPQGGRLERAAAGAAFLGSPGGGEEAGEGVRRAQAPPRGARKRLVVGIQGPAGGCPACTTGCDAPTQRPRAGQRLWLPGVAGSQALVDAVPPASDALPQLFLPGLSVRPWVGALSLLLDLPRTAPQPCLVPSSWSAAAAPHPTHTPPRAAHALVSPQPRPLAVSFRTSILSFPPPTTTTALAPPSLPPPCLISCGNVLGKQGEGLFQ